MKFTIELTEQEAEVLKKIFAQIAPTALIVTPVSKPKKQSKHEKNIQFMREYRANKAARKSKKPLKFQ